MLAIEMLPAGHGDCLLVEYGPGRRAKHRLLVDGGTASTWKVLKPRLVAWGPGPSLEALIITHIDNDHIEGAVKLLSDAKLGACAKDVWFNGWEELRAASGMLGALEGEFVSALVRRRALPQNHAFGGQPVLVPERGRIRSVELAGKMKLTPLSPTPKRLRILARAWLKAVRARQLAPGDSRGALASLRTHRKLKPGALGRVPIRELLALTADLDDAAANGSSIAVLVEYNRRRVLLAGDATPDVLEVTVRRLARQYGERRLRLDAFKLPHHGSARNVTPGLLEAVDCPRYLFSTNGQVFRHPDEEAVARVLDANRGRKGLTLYFNYASRFNKRWADPATRRHWRYSVVYPAAPEGGLRMEL